MDKYSYLSYELSKLVTHCYSTSFSMGIKAFHKSLRAPIYSIYGFVRLADEIVDTFHVYNKSELLAEFRKDTFKAIYDQISLNPILHSFQITVNEYKIDLELISTFLDSMEMDLRFDIHDQNSYQKYILGSAEVVGLMCLKVFCKGNQDKYDELKPMAQRLGAAYQKVNFLRDLNADYNQLGRIYFPNLKIEQFNDHVKIDLINEIQEDFVIAFEGIKKLDSSSRFGVYLSYIYYTSLLEKIKHTPAIVLLKSRIRISNIKKYYLMLKVFYLKPLNQLS